MILIYNLLILQNEVSGIPLVNYHDVCTRGTDGNSKYCSEHKCSAMTIARSKSQRDDWVSEITVPGMSIYPLWRPVINLAGIYILLSYRFFPTQREKDRNTFVTRLDCSRE